MLRHGKGETTLRIRQTLREQTAPASQQKEQQHYGDIAPSIRVTGSPEAGCFIDFVPAGHRCPPWNVHGNVSADESHRLF
jgi:hypothetical protein